MPAYTYTNYIKLRDGRLALYKQTNCDKWLWRAFINGKTVTRSTKTTNLSIATSTAETEYDRIRFESLTPNGVPAHRWEEAVKRLENYIQTLDLSLARKTSRLRDYRIKLGILSQFFKDMMLHTIKAKTIEEYVNWRQHDYRPERPNFHHKKVSGKTLEGDFRVLRQVLKYAKREEWIMAIPEFPKIRIEPRPSGWFTEKEYNQLVKFSLRWRNQATDEKERAARRYAHDYMIWLVHTGMRVDEALKIQFQDISQVDREQEGKVNWKDTLYVWVREGKLAYIKRPTEMLGLYGAVSVFDRLKRERPQWKPTDLLFPINPRDTLRQLLRESGLGVDENGRRRTSKSFRHTYMMFRILAGVDVYKLAMNCRTSVKIIQSHYGSYLTARMGKDELSKFRPKKQFADLETEPIA